MEERENPFCYEENMTRLEMYVPLVSDLHLISPSLQKETEESKMPRNVFHMLAARGLSL